MCAASPLAEAAREGSPAHLYPHLCAQVHAYAPFQDWSQGGTASVCAATSEAATLLAITGHDILFPIHALARLSLIHI